MKHQILSRVAVAGGCLWLASCDSQKVTGTMDETNAGAARLMDSTGTPVANANLLVFQPQDTTGRPVTTGVTLADGSYSLPTVADGMYRVVARVTTGKIAVQDSVYTNQGKLQVRTDTIRSPGSLSGAIKMVGDDNPSSVEVSVLGSDASVVTVKSDGTYRLEGLGAGTWKLKFSPKLSGYTNTYVVAKSKATTGVNLDTVVMNYIGILPVQNLTAIMDYPHNSLRLTWKVPAGSPPVRDFIVQSATGSGDPYDRGVADSSVFVDRFGNDYSAKSILYYVKIRTMDGTLGRVAYLLVKYSNPFADSLRRVDSAYGADTLAALLRWRDSVQRVDSATIRQRIQDSLRQADSLSSGHHLTDSLARLDSIRRADSILATLPGNTDTVNHLAVRNATLDSLARMKSVQQALLDSVRAGRDSGSIDTVAVKAQIQLIQQKYDSLSTAPLAVLMRRAGPRLAALHPGWSRREILVARLEDLWLRDEEISIG